jgi:hypothetical protein
VLGVQGGTRSWLWLCLHRQATVSRAAAPPQHASPTRPARPPATRLVQRQQQPWRSHCTHLPIMLSGPRAALLGSHCRHHARGKPQGPTVARNGAAERARLAAVAGCCCRGRALAVEQGHRCTRVAEASQGTAGAGLWRAAPDEMRIDANVGEGVILLHPGGVFDPCVAVAWRCDAVCSLTYRNSGVVSHTRLQQCCCVRRCSSSAAVYWRSVGACGKGGHWHSTHTHTHARARAQQRRGTH